MAIHGLVVGTGFGTGIELPQDKFSEGSDGSRVITRAYRTLWVDWLSRAPVRGSAHPIYPAAKLETREAEQIEPALLCDVTLTYREPAQDSLEEPGAVLPPDEYTQSASEVEVPIEAHPNFGTFGTVGNGAIFEDGRFVGWKASSAYAGFLTYKVGSVTESVTTYFWSKPSGVEGLVGSVSGNWLTLSGSIARRGIYWTRTINRLYSSRGWPVAIYGS